MTPPNKIVLTDEQVAWLKDNYATSLNDAIRKHLGISMRTLNRFAKTLGLSKDRDAIEVLRCERIAVEAHKRALLGKCKPHPENGLKTRFKTGYKARERFGEEKFAEMHRKTVETRRKTYLEERARVAFGLPQRTKMRVSRQPRQKIYQRYYLKKHGYILDEPNCIAYWTDATQRATKLEAMPKRFYTFKPYAEHQREHQDQPLAD